MAAFVCYLFVLLINLFDYSESSSLLCDSEYCKKYIEETGCTEPAIHCSVNNATHSGLRLPSPTICNCCDYCLPFIVKGDHCSTGGPGTGTTVGRCGDGLTCAVDPESQEPLCTRMTSECHSLQDDYDARQARGEVGAMEQRPLCDGKGRHAAIECVPGHTCFCKSQKGERIFGEAINGAHTVRHMQCGCSRLYDKIKTSISPGVPMPVRGPRCTGDGNFNPVQCLDRTCYCVNPTTGLILEDFKSINLDRHPITKLDCYDPNLDLFPEYSRGDPPYQYTTPCYDEMEEMIEFLEQSEEEGYNVDFGGGFTECYPDGTYGRFGFTRTGIKVCVDDRGRRIGNYEAEPGTAAFQNMDCKCALTSHYMGAATEKPTCCKNGNFRPVQCRRGLCRCVDSDGRQTARENSNVNSLSCFTQNWKDC